MKSHIIKLINFLDEKTSLVDLGRAVDVVYPDFNKAFDTVFLAVYVLWNVVPHRIQQWDHIFPNLTFVT